MERWNSAYRLSVIASRALKSGHAESFRVWVHAFGINDQDAQIKSLGVVVAERLIWANEELDRLEAHLRSEPEYQELYDRPIRLFRQVASPLLLGQSSQHITTFLTEDVVRDFKHMNRAMEVTEVRLTEEDLSAFEQQLETIRATLVANIDERLRAIIERHLKLMQRAIDAYPVFGARAFDDALKDSFLGLGLANREFSESEKEADRTAVKSAMDSWKGIREKIETVRAAAGLALAFGKLVDVVFRIGHD